MANLKGCSFLTLLDFKTEEIRHFIDLGKELKAKKKNGIREKNLDGKNIVLIFDKSSTRTRCSFEVAAFDEGANVTYLTNSQMNKKESIEDTAKVLGRFYDGIQYRGFEQKTVENLAKYSGVPVWNGLTDVDHPTQVIADFMTIEEKIDKPLKDVKLVFVGDARNNMGDALMYGCAKMGMTFIALAPKELYPSEEVVNISNKVCEETGGKIIITSDIKDIEGADIIYTDIWVSMGEEDKLKERVELLTPYKVTEDMLKATKNDDVVFMHCLPSYHDFETQVAKDALAQGLDVREVTDEVFRSESSVVFDQAENRMHAIKAIMVATMTGK
jgi:ornithine carbamoyltransferase